MKCDVTKPTAPAWSFTGLLGHGCVYFETEKAIAMHQENKLRRVDLASMHSTIGKKGFRSSIHYEITTGNSDNYVC